MANKRICSAILVVKCSYLNFHYSIVFLQTDWGYLNYTGRAPQAMWPVCGFSFVNVFMNLCGFECVRPRERLRPTAAKARSTDIIEDDISDYPKDRNLSLSVIYLNCFIILHSQCGLQIGLRNKRNSVFTGLNF